jgi:predicted Zn finger-like uncharacterized protein
MKIVCDSCAAKYSIADEKVAGRVFKIRCKKCGAAIVVRGDQGASEAAPAAGAAASFDYGGEAVWHAVVDGEQQGPFAPSQLGSMISAGTIGWDAYVWREGFEDWKPAQDIEELVQAIMNPGGGAAGGAEDPFTDAPTMASPSPAEKSAPPKAAKSGRDAGADLFAQSEASPFGGGGGDDDDVVASAASPRVSAGQAMTGARNENSVLFSLSNLQALATGAPGGGGGGGSSSSSRGAASPAPKAGMAMGEGSGLIDIRALASATGLTGGGSSSGPVMGSAPPKVDDLLSIGSPSVGLGSALGAPVIIPEKKEASGGGGSTMIVAAAIVAVALLGGAGIFAYVTVNQPDPAATGPATVAAIAPGATAAPPPTTPAPTLAVAPTAPTTPTAEAAPTTPTTTATAPTTPSSSGSSPRRGHGSSSPSSSATASADPPSSPSTPSSSPSSSRGSSSSDRDIDSLLEGALGSSPRRAAPSSSSPSTSASSDDSSLAATPSRSDVTTAMGRITGAVTACGGGEHGVATVQISVAGPTGHVSNATVGGQFAGTPVGSCIARAVRTASFPHFRNPTFSFTYPFRL